MANISSNKLGVFLIEPGSTSPLEVLKSTSALFTGVNDAALDAAGLVATDYAYVLSSTGAFLGLGKVEASGSDLQIVATTDTPVVLAAATSTSLEASNTINEVAARDGSGSSKNFIASGALSWNVSVDGLLDISGSTGSAVSLTDAAAAQKYVHVEFDTDVSSTNDQSTVKYVGQALIGSVTLSGGVDDIATYSATLQGYGDLYKVA